MIDTNSVIVGIGYGAGAMVVGKLLLGGIKNLKGNSGNPNSLREPQYKDTCDATHEGLNTRLKSMDNKLDQLLAK